MGIESGPFAHVRCSRCKRHPARCVCEKGAKLLTDERSKKGDVVVPGRGEIVAHAGSGSVK